MSITGFNIDGKTEKVDYNSLDNLPESGEWELLQRSNDVELRSIRQTHDGTYNRYVVRLSGKALTSNSDWRFFPNWSAVTLLKATIGTHAYGSATYFFIELPKNGPALFWSSDSVTSGNGSGKLNNGYMGVALSDEVESFALVANDSSLEYTSLNVKIWGCKA